MVAIKHELDTVQQVKEEIEELREYVDRLEEHTHRRKLRLLEQVCSLNYLPCCVIKYLNFISLFMYKPKHQEPTTNNPEPDNHTTKKPPRTTRTSIHPATQNHWRQKLPPWRTDANALRIGLSFCPHSNKFIPYNDLKIG